MTRAEYLEFVEEGLAFPDTGVGSPDPNRILYDHEEVILRLRAAHVEYCNKVAAILEIPRAHEESGGPEDRPDAPIDARQAVVGGLMQGRLVLEATKKFLREH